MHNLAIAFLALIGLFTGGCSLYFIASFGLDPFVLIFAVPGLIIATLCFRGIRSDLRQAQSGEKPPNPPPSQGDAP